MFFEDALFLAFEGLSSFAVVAPLDGISHGCLIREFMLSSVIAMERRAVELTHYEVCLVRLPCTRSESYMNGDDDAGLWL